MRPVPRGASHAPFQWALEFIPGLRIPLCIIALAGKRVCGALERRVRLARSFLSVVSVSTTGPGARWALTKYSQFLDLQ